VADHTALDKASDIGFSLSFKPDLTTGSLVEYYLRSMKLVIEPDGRLKYQVITDDGPFQVLSDPIDISVWHQVAAHYKENQLWLEVDGVLYTVPATGDLKRVTGPVGLEIASGYTGLMTQFRVIDWSFPALLTFPNGKIEMDLTIGPDGSSQVSISSTGQMGNRPVASGPAGFSIAFGFFVPNAYADDGSGFKSWWGNVWSKTKNGLKKGAIAVVNANQYVERVSVEFLRGALTGDASTPAGIVGDIVVGFIPFGDGRDIALQSYYLRYDPEKFDKTIYTLAWVGLGADLLIETGVGAVLNAAIAGSKTVIRSVKLIHPSAYKVLGEYLEFVHTAIKNKGDWKLVQNMIPFLQLIATVAIDTDLRDLIFSAISSVADLEAWISYLHGWKGEEQEAASLNTNPALDFFAKPAYADTISALRKTLRELLQKFPNLQRKDLGKGLTEIFKSLNWAKVGNTRFAPKIYEQKTIDACMNLYIVGKRAAVQAIAEVGSTAKYSSLLKRDIGRRLDDLLDDIAAFDLNLYLPANRKAIREGYEKVVKELSATLNKAKGAAHHIRAIRHYGANVTKVSLKREAVEVNIGGIKKFLGNREYDLEAIIDGIPTKIEAKSWLPEYVKSNVGRYLRGDKDTNAQLLTDLIAYKQNGNKGFKWVFDEGMAGQTKIFKKAILDTLRKEGGSVHDKLVGHLGKNVNVKVWVNELEGNLDDFFSVLSN
jgi:hypothetical protein